MKRKSVTPRAAEDGEKERRLFTDNGRMDLCGNFDRGKAIHIKSLNIYKNLRPRNPVVRTFCKGRVRRKGLTDEDVNGIVEDLKT